MPETAAGRALALDYPGLLGLEYGKTGEPIIAAIEAEARALGRAEALAAVRAYIDWQYRMPGAPRFTLANLRDAIDNLETPHA